MELPSKREYEREITESGVEEVASKKAKTEEEEAGSDDEIMLDSVVKQEEEEEEEEEEIWSDFEFMSNFCEEMQEEEKKEDRVREYQIFFQFVDPERAKQISSEKDAFELFSDDEMKMFWQMYWNKEWHIRPNRGSLSDYERLAVYYSEDQPYYYQYVHYYYSYDFDCKYQKFTEELNEAIQWGTTLSDARAIAEGIWKRHMEVVMNLKLLDESIFEAMHLSNVRQEAKELIQLFVDLYKREREVDGEDFVQALKVIIEQKGLECYPYCKVYIEEALKEVRGPWGRIRFKYDYMKKHIRIPRGEASLEDNKLKDLVSSYFEDLLTLMSGGDISGDISGDSYIDYVKDKIRVAHELQIL